MALSNFVKFGRYSKALSGCVKRQQTYVASDGECDNIIEDTDESVTVPRHITDEVVNTVYRVRYGQSLSVCETLTTGVPQGTKLGPIIFLCMINDACQSLNDRWKYVDDLSLGENRHNSEESHLQDQANSLAEWSESAQLKLNPGKCMVFTVCFMRNPSPPVPISLCGNPLRTVEIAKVLGVWLQSNLKWDTQVSETTKKGNKRLFMLLKSFGVLVEDLVTVYCGFIRPILEYCAPVWHHGLTRKQTATMERVQKRACRIILGQKYTDYTTGLQMCKLDTLEKRRAILCTKFAHSITTSERTADLLPNTRRQEHGRNLRNSNKMTLAPCRTARFQNSPVPSLLSLLKATVTTRRTCFCVLSTCTNVGKCRASVRGEYTSVRNPADLGARRHAVEL
ncbi:hypothetical protein Bbelb_276050 [Branchiostoma belcheri]|nr:hypothetical protein Bbelb_276050 [Branchiostoma belcheri]